MQFLFRERAGFVDAVAAYGEPVKEWRAVKINKLAEEVLVHLRRRVRVAPDGEFQPRLEHDAGITDAQHRLHTNIENSVQRVAAHDGQLAGKGEAAAEIAQAKVAIDGRKCSGRYRNALPTSVCCCERGGAGAPKNAVSS